MSGAFENEAVDHTTVNDAPAIAPAISQPQQEDEILIPNNSVAAAAVGEDWQLGSFLPPSDDHVPSQDQMLRRKSRPDYSPLGSMASPQQLTSVAIPQPEGPSHSRAPPQEITPEPQHQVGGSASRRTKKPRGKRGASSNTRPQGPAVDATATGFTHVLSIKAGEDVYSKIMNFSPKGREAACTLHANGSIAKAALHQPGVPGGTVTYEGLFDIISLSSGVLVPSEVAGSRTGALSICMQARDGRIFGGSVDGLLVAASPVQVILGRFPPDGRR